MTRKQLPNDHAGAHACLVIAATIVAVTIGLTMLGVIS